MKLLALLLAVAAFIAAQTEPKNLQITTGNGTFVKMRAEEMVREPNLIHLKGKVEVQTWLVRPSYQSVLLTADEAVYHVDTGEIEASGNVRVRAIKEK
jgi:lipopolysaccharide assembly outer membrane protein LptD (OstA)